MKNSRESVDSVLSRMREHDLRHITLGYFDTNARLRAKHYNAANLEKALKDGTAMNLAVLAMDPADNPIRTNPFAMPDHQFRDGVLLLVADTCRSFPLAADGAGLLILGQLVDEWRVHCPRAILHAECERLRAIGFEPFGAFEYECYLLDETTDSLRSKVPDAVVPRRGFEKMYSFVDQVGEDAFLSELIRVCDTMDIGIDTMHCEYTTLLEAALLPRRGVACADNAALYKSVAKAISRKHGLLASFMALRGAREQGCGAHLNVSLVDAASGAGCFYDDRAADCISQTLRHFLGGLQAYIPELFLMLAPNFNSYRRYAPGLFTPTSNTWGIANKTTAFRVVNISPAAARVELRIPGADVNPYFGLAAVVLAGRRGIEERLMPAAGVEGNGWKVESPPGREFPAGFEEAIARFDASALARATFGDRFVDFYVADRRWQLAHLNATITDWELRMFAEGA
jgi:glutamine synthetase